MVIEHRIRDKHQNANSLSKKTEFYERQEQREANRPEIKEGYSFMIVFLSRDGSTSQANRYKITPNYQKSPHRKQS